MKTNKSKVSLFFPVFRIGIFCGIVGVFTVAVWLVLYNLTASFFNFEITKESLKLPKIFLLAWLGFLFWIIIPWRLNRNGILKDSSEYEFFFFWTFIFTEISFVATANLLILFI